MQIREGTHGGSGKFENFYPKNAYQNMAGKNMFVEELNASFSIMKSRQKFIQANLK